MGLHSIQRGWPYEAGLIRIVPDERYLEKVWKMIMAFIRYQLGLWSSIIRMPAWLLQFNNILEEEAHQT